MSCYFRHLDDLFAEAGIEVTKENRKALGAHIAELVGKRDAHCPEVWREVKVRRADPAQRAALVKGLRAFTAA